MHAFHWPCARAPRTASAGLAGVHVSTVGGVSCSTCLTRSRPLLTYLDGAWEGATGSGIIIGLVLNLLNVWLFPPACLPACLPAYLSVRPSVCLPVLALVLPRFGGFLPASKGIALI